MPEGPEIYSFGVDLYRRIHNTYLLKIKLISGKYKETKLPGSVLQSQNFRRNKRKAFKGYNLLRKILPSKILSIETYGKILIMKLEENYNLIFTFGMTGFITFSNIKHNHIKFTTSKKIFYYNDQRNFGNIYLLKTEILVDKLKYLGPDLLNDNITFDIFKNQFNKFRDRFPEREICLLLFDQSFVTGIGNYLRSDILWLSKINPYCQLKDITNNQLKILYYNSYNLIRYYASIQIEPKIIKKYINTNIIKSKLKYKLKYVPKDYDRDFFIYEQDIDIFSNKIIKDQFYGRSIYWTKKRQN